MQVNIKWFNDIGTSLKKMFIIVVMKDRVLSVLEMRSHFQFTYGWKFLNMRKSNFTFFVVQTIS